MINKSLSTVKKGRWGDSGFPVVRAPMRRVQVGKLRSHMPYGHIKNQKYKIEAILQYIQ